jgi:hypothetical protein
MSAVEEILSQIPMGQLAGKLGVDEQTAEQATRHALPALLGGIQANTEHPGGAASFAEAVGQHDGSLVDGGVNLDQVDPGEGQKIVQHVFGDQHGQVVQQLGGVGGAGGQDLIQKLLPLLAPIVMSYLSQKVLGGGGGAAPGGGGIGGVLGGLLSGVLGGGGGAGGNLAGGNPAGGNPAGGNPAGGNPAGGNSGGPDLGSLLGGLLGGGRK